MDREFCLHLSLFVIQTAFLPYSSHYVNSSAGICYFGGIFIIFKRFNPRGAVNERLRVMVDFRYLSDGTKIGVKDAAGNGYEYLGSLIYRRTPNGLEIESTDFAAGRILKTSTKYDLRYFVRDYLGSVRAIVNAQGQRLEAIDYMPYGSRWKDPMRLVTDNRYLFNGKEWQPTGDLDVLDYGARQYDPELGRWFNPDPAMQFLNPYTFCANDPVNGVDTDGNLVIFINGFSARYWAKNYFNPGNLLASGTNWKGTRGYWRSSDNFDLKVMAHLRDYNAIYRDGNSLGLLRKSFYPNNRFKDGYRQGRNDAQRIVAQLFRDKYGNIIETIKVITHSMGAAYGKGYVTALAEYLESIGLSRSIIAFEADFAAFQSNQQQAVDGIPTYQISHAGDNIAGDEIMPGAIVIDTSSDRFSEHWLNSFIFQIYNLPTGNYNYNMETGEFNPI